MRNAEQFELIGANVSLFSFSVTDKETMQVLLTARGAAASSCEWTWVTHPIEEVASNVWTFLLEMLKGTVHVTEKLNRLINFVYCSCVT